MNVLRATLLGMTALAITAIPCVAQGIGGALPVEDGATAIKEKLGNYVPKTLRFRDHTGKEVTLGDYFTGKRPVILNIVYFGCPGLCTAVTTSMVNGLVDIERDPDLLNVVPGKDVEILTISFDPKEHDKQQLAAGKRESYLDQYKNPAADNHWHFLRGDADNCKALVEATGFGYRWNQTTLQWDHRAVLMFLSPEGKITRYIYGANYDAKTFRLAVVEASEGTVGTTMEKILLSCYGYDPKSGSYSKIGPGFMFVGGILIVLAFGSLLFVLWRRELRRPSSQPAGNPSTETATAT